MKIIRRLLSGTIATLMLFVADGNTIAPQFAEEESTLVCSSSAEPTTCAGTVLSESVVQNEQIRAAMQSEEAKVVPSKGTVVDSPEFKYDENEDYQEKGRKKTDVRMDSTGEIIDEIKVPVKPVHKENTKEPVTKEETTFKENSTTEKETATDKQKETSSASETSSVSETSSTSQKEYVVKSIGNSVNIREGAGVRHPVITQADKGDVFTYISEKQDEEGRIWYCIETEKGRGYIISQYSVLEEKGTQSQTEPTTASSTEPSATHPSGESSDGWIEKDGKTYFYIEGKPITGWKDINGLRYRFGDDGVLSSQCGIDVSKHQGKIDWVKVKRAGIQFAYIRVGFRGYETGRIVLDPLFYDNLKGAQAQGIKCGVYFYSAAKNEVEGVQEANFVIEALKGCHIDLQVAFDMEELDHRTSGLTNEQRTNVAIAFLETIREAGLSPMLYTYHYYYNNCLQSDRLKNYPLWIAYYTNNEKYVTENYVCWQYSESGRLDGISENVDLDIWTAQFV